MLSPGPPILGATCPAAEMQRPRWGTLPMIASASRPSVLTVDVSGRNMASVTLRGEAGIQTAGGSLLEREEQLAALGDCLRDAGSGRGRLVLVAGEAGIGKTTLVEHFCQSARRPVRWCCGVPAMGCGLRRPLSPLIDVARSTGGALQVAIDNGEKPAGCFEALRRELERHRRPVLVIEDLHWADEATFDVMTMLGRRMGDLPALAIATFRDDWLSSEPLRAAIGELQTGAAVSRLDLLPLSEGAVDALVGDADLPFDPGELHSLTAGNPFFVNEVLVVKGRPAAGERPRRGAGARDAFVRRRAGCPGGDCRGAAARRSLAARCAARPAAGAARRVPRLGNGQRLGRRRGIPARAGSAGDRGADCAASSRQAAPPGPICADGARWSGCRCCAARTPRRGRGRRTSSASATRAVAAQAAAAAGAHREAVAHYERVLRFAGDLELTARAEMHVRHSEECHFINEFSGEQSSLQAAIECYRELGDPVGEGRVWRLLGHATECRTGDFEAGAALIRRSVEVLETTEPGLELAMSYLSVGVVQHRDRGSRARRRLAAPRDGRSRGVEGSKIPGSGAHDRGLSGVRDGDRRWSGESGARPFCSRARQVSTIRPGVRT